MATYVIVHGAWHDGSLFEETAAPLRAAGHTVHLPTLLGNRPGDAKTVGLEQAIASIVDYIVAQDLHDIVLGGHSYGGMIITGTADRIGERIRRLVYWNAFVPNDGESLYGMVPQHYVGLFDQLVQKDGSFMLPFDIWREAFINDGSAEQARAAYAKLNPHPRRTFADPIRLRRNPAEFPMPKSYINLTEDTALPHSHGWHPRLSEKLGLFRLIQGPGSHELCFTDPARLGQLFLQAGQD
jgi:pimeloyl-ACP methyl ester carboxylesterase